MPDSSLFAKLKKWIVGKLEPEFSAAVLRFNTGPWAIDDGVSYRQPVPLAGHDKALIDALRRQTATPQFVMENLSEAVPNWARTQFGSPYMQGRPVMMPAMSDPLAEWDIDTRIGVLEQCHLACERNPVAKAAENYTRLFAIGDGATITYSNEEVEAACTEFLEDPENSWDELEGQLCEDLFTDGELFIRFHQGRAENAEDPNDIIITTIPAWAIKAIYHEQGFFRRPTEYEYRQSISDGRGGTTYIQEMIPADEILHFTINRRSYEQRGKPEIFCILPWLKAHKQHLENLARNTYYTNILYDVALDGATHEQVAARIAALQEPPAGAVVSVHTTKEQWQMMDTNRTGGSDLDLGRELKLMGAVGVQLPEYMLSDGENANLASATAQQMPAIKTFEDWQSIMKRVVTGILRKVLELKNITGDVAAIDADGESTGETIAASKAFEVQYQKLESTDPKSIVEALLATVSGELMSRQTAMGKLPFGIDPETEQRKIDEEREKDIDDIMKGRRGLPLGMELPGDESGGEDEEDEENESDNDSE
jgi:hypothetical protein